MSTYNIISVSSIEKYIFNFHKMPIVSCQLTKCLFYSQTDYDMIDYLNELRDGCLESYTGMVQGLKGDADAPSGKIVKLLVIYWGAWWLSRRVSVSGARGLGFENYLRRVVSLSETLYSLKVLVIPRKRWLCLDMPEKLLTGTLNLNTNKETKICDLLIYLELETDIL